MVSVARPQAQQDDFADRGAVQGKSQGAQRGHYENNEAHAHQQDYHALTRVKLREERSLQALYWEHNNRRGSGGTRYHYEYEYGSDHVSWAGHSTPAIAANFCPTGPVAGHSPVIITARYCGNACWSTAISVAIKLVNPAVRRYKRRGLLAVLGCWAASIALGYNDE